MGGGGVGSAYSGLAFAEAVLGMAHAAFVEPSSRPHVECGQALPTRLLDKRTRKVGLAAAGRRKDIRPGINRLAQERGIP
jgi:hypothetical protein